MSEYGFVELEQFAAEEINGGSVSDGIIVLGATVTTCVSILGSGASLFLGVGVVAACAPAAVVVAVAGATIGGLMIGQGIANNDIV